MNKSKFAVTGFVVGSAMLVGILAWARVKEYIGDECVKRYASLCLKAQPTLFNEGGSAQKDLHKLQSVFATATPNDRKKMFCELTDYVNEKMFADGGTLITYKSFAIGALCANMQCKTLFETCGKLQSDWDTFVKSDEQKKVFTDLVNKKSTMLHALEVFKKTCVKESAQK